MRRLATVLLVAAPSAAGIGLAAWLVPPWWWAALFGALGGSVSVLVLVARTGLRLGRS